MSTNKQISEPNEPPGEIWPRKLNKLLIGVGVLAFGLIIADRLTSMFEADDLPAVADVEQSDEMSNAALSTADDSTAVELKGEGVSSLSGDENELIVEDPLSIDAVFGSPLVFVSASEPVYVITEDNVRIDLGGALSDDITLAGVTGDKVILDNAGALMSISLPDPDSQ